MFTPKVTSRLNYEIYIIFYYSLKMNCYECNDILTNMRNIDAYES